MKKLKEALQFVKKNPRYIVFFSTLIYNLLQTFSIEVDQALFNAIVDVVFILATGRVWQKSEKDSLL